MTTVTDAAGSTTTPVVTISDVALSQIVQLRDQETLPDLALGLRISGINGGGYAYETAFLRQADVADADHIEFHEGLMVAIPVESVPDLQGSLLDMSEDPSTPGLVLRNPNTPSPSLERDDLPPLELTGTVEERVTQLLDERINPGIAAHGGVANLVKIDGSAAVLQLGGGCQGCGLAAMTLRQGIETAIIEAVPEITEVVDVTDHEAGANPYY